LFNKIKDFFRDLADSVKKEAGSISVIEPDFGFEADISDIYAPITGVVAKEGGTSAVPLFRTAQDIDLRITDLEQEANAFCSVKGFDSEKSGCLDNIIQSAVLESAVLVVLFETPGTTARIVDFSPPGSGAVIYDESPEEYPFSTEQILTFPLYFVKGVLVYTEELMEGGRPKNVPLFASIKVNASDRMIAQFAMRRQSVSRESYSTGNIKNALAFILDRVNHKPRLRWIGIFRDVPINRIKQLTFSESTLSFTLNSLDRRSIYVLDVLVVYDEVMEKYHIAPIVRG